MNSPNQSILHYTRPDVLIRRMYQIRELLWQFIWRGVQERYRGSYLGILWALLTPLAMLAAYAFAFLVIFRAEGPPAPTANLKTNFALMLFTGLIAFTVFAECATQAPTLIIRNPNLVKRVVFPLEVLPVGIVGAAVIHSLISLLVVVAALMLLAGTVPWTILYLPLFYLPLMALSLGLAWILASLGVFLRDIAQVMAVAVQFLMFLTPVFYPTKLVQDNVSPQLFFIYQLNPLAAIVEGFRHCVLYGQAPQWSHWAIATAISLAIMIGGFAWFMKIKRAFADVI